MVSPMSRALAEMGWRGRARLGAVGLLAAKFLTSLKIVIPRTYGRVKNYHSTPCSTDSRFSNSSLPWREI